MDVITPAIMFRPDGSAPGELGRSSEATEESLACLDERDPLVLALSRSPPSLPSSLTSLLSFLLLLEKNDFPPEDCLAFESALDMIGNRG
jgi:hypothetical protein